MAVEKVCIDLKNITKSYETPVLKDISLHITNSDYIAIVGMSGAGKSTLMNIIGLIEGYDSGTYEFDGELINNKLDYAKIRREKIGFIFQAYNLIATLTCKENIELPSLYSRTGPQDIDSLSGILNVSHLLDKKTAYLSGGEKQRVAIARAMINNPSVLLADEPTGALDVKTTDEIMKVFRNLNKNGTTVIIITHDMEVAGMCDRIIEISDGKII